MKRIKVISVLISLVLVLALFVGCGESASQESSAGTASVPADESTAKTEDTLSMAYISFEGDAYMMQLQQGCQAFCEENGIECHVLTYPLDQVEQNETKNIEDAITLGVDMIVLSPCYAENCEAAMARAAEQGIITVDVNNVAEWPGKITHVGVAEYDQCYAVSEEICSRLEPGSNVLIIGGTEGIPVHMERVNGFATAAKDAGLNVYDTIWTDTTGEDSAAKLEDAITRYGADKIDAIFNHSGSMAVALPAVLEQNGIAPGEVLIGGLGGFGVEKDMMEEGWLTATTGMSPFTQGYTAAECAFGALNGTQYEKTTYSEVFIITIDNYNTDYADYQWIE